MSRDSSAATGAGTTKKRRSGAYRHFPQFNLHRGVILEKYYNEGVIRENLRHLPAHEAFRYLMEHQQYLFGRVSDKYLASYLGISLIDPMLGKAAGTNRIAGAG